MVENRKFLDKYLNKVIGNLAYREMLFYKKAPSAPPTWNGLSSDMHLLHYLHINNVSRPTLRI